MGKKYSKTEYLEEHQRQYERQHSEQAPEHTTVEIESPWSPPPYSAQRSDPPTTDANGDSPYAFLREFDTIFVVDDSSSMLGQ